MPIMNDGRYISPTGYWRKMRIDEAWWHINALRRMALRFESLPESDLRGTNTEFHAAMCQFTPGDMYHYARLVQNFTDFVAAHMWRESDLFREDDSQS